MEYLQRVIIAETAKLIDINEKKNKQKNFIVVYNKSN